MKRSYIIALAVAVLVVGVLGVFWAFGTPQAPPPVATDIDSVEGVAAAGGPDSPDPGVPPSASGMPAMGGGDPSAIGKEAPPPDPNSPLAIQIPGCKCHSDDKKIVEEHASYRMNQCFGCHSGEAPTGPQ